MERNAAAGIILRPGPPPVEVHACTIRRCQVHENAQQRGRAQIEIHGAAHDITLTDNKIVGASEPARAGIYVAPGAERIFMQGNTISGCRPQVITQAASLVTEEPAFACGIESLRPRHSRHLAPQTPAPPNSVS